LSPKINAEEVLSLVDHEDSFTLENTGGGDGGEEN
jgi:hypothetical protein